MSDAHWGCKSTLQCSMRKGTPTCFVNEARRHSMGGLQGIALRGLGTEAH